MNKVNLGLGANKNIWGLELPAGTPRTRKLKEPRGYGRYFFFYLPAAISHTECVVLAHSGVV